MRGKHYQPFWIGLVGCVLLLATSLLYGQLSHRLHSAPGATLSVGPNLASPGTTVMVTGFHYVASKKVEVYFQNRANGVVDAVTNGGGFFNVALQLPRQYSDGPSYVYAVSDSITTRVPLHFATPSLTYTAAEASKTSNEDLPSSVLVRGTGFMANEQVSFEFRNEAATVQTGKLTTDSNGTFTLPISTEDGSYQSSTLLTISDTRHTPAWRIPIHFTPRIRVLPVTGPVGTRVSIYGKGFKRYENVRLSFQSTVVGWAHTNRFGRFHTAFQVPGTATLSPSTNDVSAVGLRSGVVAWASFQVQPSSSVYPRVTSPNGWISSMGSQFSPNGRVEIVFVDPNISSSSVGTIVRTLTASSRGQFATIFQIPSTASHNKTYNIVDIDDTTGMSSVTPIFVQ
ncbi:hypothetical protein [Dictyobacter halimunensis]|uniref:hypothetical protein n=1 Tax=Dictyobacter halimunensis TaxID=3026934 RepID=UPI0030C6D89C